MRTAHTRPPASPPARRRAATVAAQLLAIPCVAALLVAGVWVAGGRISDDFRTSMLLTGAWFALSGAACLFVAVRSRPLRLPVVGAYLITAAVVGGYLGLSTFRDQVVDERVVTAGPPPAAAPAPADARDSRNSRDSRDAEPPAVNVEVARGRFRSHEHTTAGRASVVRLPDGRRFLTLTSFETDAGPDLRVRLVPGDTYDGGAPGAVDLGALKGNRGDQQYELPRGARVAGGTVVIWCRAFSAPFGSARLEPPSRAPERVSA